VVAEGVGRESAAGEAANQKPSSGEIGRLCSSKYEFCQASLVCREVHAVAGFLDSHYRQA
jgi:hypothetical protein